VVAEAPVAGVEADGDAGADPPAAGTDDGAAPAPAGAPGVGFAAGADEAGPDAAPAAFPAVPVLWALPDSADGGFGVSLPDRVNRGGSSVDSRPTGFFSAVSSFFAANAPASSHVPSPIHGFAACGFSLCKAPLTVNNPCETPARKPSYTVPDSSAMGTGAAL